MYYINIIYIYMTMAMARSCKQVQKNHGFLTMEIMTHMINMTHSRRKNRPLVFQGLVLDLLGAMGQIPC